MFTRSKASKPRSAASTLVVSFAVVAFVGWLLLSMPVSNADGIWHFGTGSLFLAVSAVSVTGLAPVAVGATLSSFGLAVLALIVQFGGIGIMTVGMFVFMAAGRSLSVTEERSVMSATGETNPGDVPRILLSTFLFSSAWELAGAVFLALRIHALFPGLGPARAVARGVFYSVMAFCNAGFDPFGYGPAFCSMPSFGAPVCVLALVGSLGFVVHTNLIALRPWRRDRARRGRLTLHSCVALEGLCSVLAFAAVAFLALESGRGMAHIAGAGHKLFAAVFGGTTARAAGFCGIPLETLTPASVAVTATIMFAGAAPGSTGGGVKTTTLWVLWSTVTAMFGNRQCPELHGRTVPRHVVNEAVAVLVLYILLGLFTTVGLLIAENPEHGRVGQLLFESVSAFCNNGLSVGGTTAGLSRAGRIVLCLAMFTGRVGPAALVLSLFRTRLSDKSKRYPEENIVI